MNAETAFELVADTGRDRWIAADAARRISECEPINTIESECLEALNDWITFELWNRSN